MNLCITILLIWSCIYLILALPVTKKKKDEKEEANTPQSPDVESALEYERYLKEVVEVLETDPEFRKKLDKAPQADIRNGKIAQELEYVNHNVRTKLDEIKRRELDRLKELANKEFELKNDIDRNHLKINQHLNHTNERTFEIDDLEKLIKKTAEDLAEADRKRQAEFKQYEMQKEFEKNMLKKQLNEEQRSKFEKEQEELAKKHKKHEKVHHPGNKAQLEEVWEKQDRMDKQDFDPKIFFMTHDVDGNGFWDQDEVKALFVKELDKVYQSGLPEDDMRERAEEMELMREQLFKETDTNRDDLISFQEFIEQTKREEYVKDSEWRTIDEQPQYTHEEYLEFERRRKEEIDRMIAQGLLAPHPNMPQEYQQQQMHYQNPQQQHMQQQQQYQQQQQQYQQQQYQQRQYQEQQVHLNSNQVYQQLPVQQQHQQPQQQNYQQEPQQLVNSLPTQQQHQPKANYLPSQQQPVTRNAGDQLQPDVTNIRHQDPPLGANNISQQQQQVNYGIPQQPFNNVQHHIPQKH